MSYPQYLTLIYSEIYCAKAWQLEGIPETELNATAASLTQQLG